MKHLSEMPEPPSTLRPEVSHDLDAVVMRALAKDPDQRYDSAEEMDADLARVARGVARLAADRGGDDAGARRTAPPRPRRRSSRGRPTAVTRRRRPPTGRRPTTTSRRAPLALAVAARPARARDRGRRRLPGLRQDPEPARPEPADHGHRRRPADQEHAAIQISRPGPARARRPRSRATRSRVGSVIGQNPGAGDRVAKDSTVTITVSTGKPKVQVPAVTGFTLAAGASPSSSTRA